MEARRPANRAERRPVAADAVWLGGPAGSGKTTVARRLARRHGLRLYSADTRTWEHRDRAVAAGVPAALRWESLTPQQRLAEATPEDELEMSLHCERGAMVANDVAALPAAPLVIAEGTTVLPSAVLGAGVEPRRTLWLLPTPSFRKARLDEREVPAEVRERMNALYALVSDLIEREVRDLGAPALVVDGSVSLIDTVAFVEERFAEALAAGPRARSVEERRALVREANEALARQVHGYVARPFTSGTADVITRPFACECDDLECDELLVIPVAEWERRAAAGPVVA